MAKTQTYTCRLWIPTDRIVTVTLAGTEKLAPNFTARELANTKARETVKLEMGQRSWEFLRELQRLRDRYYAQFGRGLDVSSFYRTASFNKTLAGASPNSAHLDARAADLINIPQTRYDLIARWWSDITAAAGKVGGINYYADDRVHVTDYEQKFGNSAFKVRDYRGGKR